MGCRDILPFAPEIVLPTLAYLDATRPEMTGEYGYKCSFNPSFCEPAGTSGEPRQPGKTASANKRHAGWLSKGYYAIDQGPVVLMIENYRSGLIWRLMRIARISSTDCATPDSRAAG